MKLLGFATPSRTRGKKFNCYFGVSVDRPALPAMKDPPNVMAMQILLRNNKDSIRSKEANHDPIAEIPADKGSRSLGRCGAKNSPVEESKKEDPKQRRCVRHRG